MKFPVRSNSQAFYLGCANAVRASRHPTLRAIGKDRRERITEIAMMEWEQIEKAFQGTAANEQDFERALRSAVVARVKQQKWGFVWWLPLVLWAVELIIKILIQRWWPK
jgi:hypothetical protein